MASRVDPEDKVVVEKFAIATYCFPLTLASKTNDLFLAFLQVLITEIYCPKGTWFRDDSSIWFRPALTFIT